LQKVPPVSFLNYLTMNKIVGNEKKFTLGIFGGLFREDSAIEMEKT